MTLGARLQLAQPLADHRLGFIVLRHVLKHLQLTFQLRSQSGAAVVGRARPRLRWSARRSRGGRGKTRTAYARANRRSARCALRRRRWADRAGQTRPSCLTSCHRAFHESLTPQTLVKMKRVRVTRVQLVQVGGGIDQRRHAAVFTFRDHQRDAMGVFGQLDRPAAVLHVDSPATIDDRTLDAGLGRQRADCNAGSRLRLVELQLADFDAGLSGRFA